MNGMKNDSVVAFAGVWDCWRIPILGWFWIGL
jgi:hypothetical protein